MRERLKKTYRSPGQLWLLPIFPIPFLYLQSGKSNLNHSDFKFKFKTMFGINQISWGHFLGFILSILLVWYLLVLALAFVRQRGKRKTLFEDDQFIPVASEGFCPISVSSKDLPSELIPVRLSDDIALPASLYEETGLDEGYSIDTFSQPDNPQLPKILEQVQHQS